MKQKKGFVLKQGDCIDCCLNSYCRKKSGRQIEKEIGFSCSHRFGAFFYLPLKQLKKRRF